MEGRGEPWGYSGVGGKECIGGLWGCHGVMGEPLGCRGLVGGFGRDIGVPRIWSEVMRELWSALELI